MTQVPHVHARLLGGFEVWVDGRRADDDMGLRAQELLAYLLVFPESEHPRERLMTALWPEKDAIRGSANLRRALFLLRRTLGDVADDVLSITDAGLRLRSSAVGSDLSELARHTASAEAGDAAAAASAVALLSERGELLADRNPEWALLEQESWHRRVVDAGRVVLSMASRGHHALPLRDTLGLAHALLAIEPTDESAHAAAIALRGHLGDRAGAAAQYRRCREVLERELGVPPGADVDAALQLAMASAPASSDAWSAQPLVNLPPASIFAPESNEKSTAGVTERTVRDGVNSSRSRWVIPARARAAAVFALVAVTTLAAAWQGRTYMIAADSTTTELVNEYLVATRMERLPVQGSNPDSVDAWFRSNVAYPVHSVAGSTNGFQLYGGGLCAVFGQFAATAVYHGPDGVRASVFTFPVGDLDLPIATDVGSGLKGLNRGPYALVFSVRNGLVHAVVADLPLDQLSSVAPGLIAPDA